MGAGRSQGWGLGGLGGKSRAGQDGQVRGPGSPGRESGTSGWGRQYHPSWPQSPQSPLGSRPQRSEPSRTLPSHRPHGFLSQPPAPLTPRNLVNPSGAPPPGPPWHGGVGVGRCEWGLLGEASPQPYTHLFVLLHAFICQERPRGLWSAPQAAATFPTWAACPSLQPWRAGLVEPPKTAKSITLCHSLPSSKQRRFCPHLGPEQTACLREAPGPEPLGAPVAPHPAGSVPACPPPPPGLGTLCPRADQGPGTPALGEAGEVGGGVSGDGVPSCAPPWGCWPRSRGENRLPPLRRPQCAGQWSVGGLAGCTAPLSLP